MLKSFPSFYVKLIFTFSFYASFGFLALALLFFFIALAFSMLLFPRTLYYVIVLLLFCISSLFYLSSHMFIRSLTFIMLVVVYVGAMMVIIGYICAISPNIIFYTRGPSGLYAFFLFSFFLLFLVFFSSYESNLLTPMVDYFYSSFGLFVFLYLVFLLFITLLMVTSYYTSSKGPLS